MGLAFGLFVLFLVLAYFVRQGAFNGLDLGITLGLQTVIGHLWDIPFSFLSLLGSSEVVFLLIVALAGFVYLKSSKIFWSLGAFFGIYVIELLGKFFIYHPGPPRIFFRYNLPFAFPSSYVQTNYSFPSGHVSRTFFLAVIALFFIYKLKMPQRSRTLLIILVAIFCVAMIVSRVYLGEHWFSDVVGGILLGSSFSTLALAFF